MGKITIFELAQNYGKYYVLLGIITNMLSRPIGEILYPDDISIGLEMVYLLFCLPLAIFFYMAANKTKSNPRKGGIALAILFLIQTFVDLLFATLSFVLPTECTSELEPTPFQGLVLLVIFLWNIGLIIFQCIAAAWLFMNSDRLPAEISENK